MLEFPSLFNGVGIITGPRPSDSPKWLSKIFQNLPTIQTLYLSYEGLLNSYAEFFVKTNTMIWPYARTCAADI